MTDPNAELRSSTLRAISHSEDSGSKRRKVRKGTTSCWECKRRKKRCEFRPESHSTCNNCRRTGLECISQEFSNPVFKDDEPLAKRLDQVEELVNLLVQQRKGQSGLESCNSLQRRNVERLPTLRSVGHERLFRGRSLTGHLISIFPDPETAAYILSSRKLFARPLQMVQKLKPKPASFTNDNRDYLQISTTDHPVLFAQKLIQLAICLQQFDVSSSQHVARRIREHPNKAAKRYVDAATHLVISQDYLVCSLDGLEALILQSCYYATSGDYRTAWSIQHRSALIAQRIGLPKTAEERGGREERLWFQITYGDRFLSLIIGANFSIINNAFATTSRLSEVPSSERLERVHTAIAGQLINRNICMQRIGDIHENHTALYDHYKETRGIDNQLKKATQRLPKDWWLVPSLDGASESQAMEWVPRLLAQMHQYHLLVLLHQPYVICDQFTGLKDVDYTYSKLAAASAGREVLTRYLHIRRYRRSPSYRALDEKAFLSCVVLLFAHLHCHGTDTPNFLEHQRSHDLGTLEKVLELWITISNIMGDLQSKSLIQKLKTFMEIEEDAANGTCYSTWTMSQHSQESMKENTDKNLEVVISFPYFGSVLISPRASNSLQAEDIHSLELEKSLDQFVSGFDMSQLTSSTEWAILESAAPEDDQAWLDNWIHTEGSHIET